MATVQCCNNPPMSDFVCHQYTYRPAGSKFSVKLLNRYLTTDDILLIRSGKFGTWDDVRKYLAIELFLIRYEDDARQMIMMEVCVSLLKFSNLKCLKPIQASVFFSLVMDAFQYFMSSKSIVMESDAQKYFNHLLNQNMGHFKSCKTVQRIKQFYHNIFLFHYDLFRLVFTPQIKLEFHLLKKDFNLKENKGGRIVKCVFGPVNVTRPVLENAPNNAPCYKNYNLMSVYHFLTSTQLTKFRPSKKSGRPVKETSNALSYILDPKFQCKTLSSINDDIDQESLNEKTLRIRKEVAKLLIGKDSDLCMILSNTHTERNRGTCPPPNSCRNLCTMNDVKEIHSEPKFHPDKEASKDRPHSCHSTPLPGAPKTNDTEMDLYVKHMEEKVHKNFLHHHMNCDHQQHFTQCTGHKPNPCCGKDCAPNGYGRPMYQDEVMYNKRIPCFAPHAGGPDVQTARWHHPDLQGAYTYPCPHQTQCQCHMQFQCQYNCHHHWDSGVNIEVKHMGRATKKPSVDSNVDTLICLYSQQHPSKLQSEEDVSKDKEEKEKKDESSEQIGSPVEE